MDRDDRNELQIHTKDIKMLTIETILHLNEHAWFYIYIWIHRRTLDNEIA